MSIGALQRAHPPLPLDVGTWPKNRACRLDGHEAQGSALHGDLATAQACLALEASLRPPQTACVDTAPPWRSSAEHDGARRARRPAGYFCPVTFDSTTRSSTYR